MGVRTTWILDPVTKQAFIYSNQGTIESSESVLSCRQIELPIAELFSQLQTTPRRLDQQGRRRT